VFPYENTNKKILIETNKRGDLETMKKLSMVMAAAMCLTVGGVYATWNYAGQSVNENVNSESISLGMGTIDSSANVATVTLGANSLCLTVDGNADRSNTAVLTASDSLTINVDIDETSAVTSLDFAYKLKVNHPGEWDGDHIFTYTTDTTVSDFKSISADGSVTVTMQELVDAWGLDLREAFTLPTKDDYDAFEDALDDVELLVDVIVTANY
jgi:hypothetical protein